MLKEYFSFDITEDGMLTGLPMIIRDYVPCMDKLPVFLLRLGTEVDWDNEKDCFHTLSQELALFYRAEPPMDQIQDQRDYYLWQVQHYIFPCFKTHFIATTKLKDSVTQLANLTDLYKIFERC